MENLTITEKYSLFVLKNNEKIGSNGKKLFMRAIMICDMLIDGNIKIGEKNKVSVTDNIPTAEYYRIIYNDIKELDGKIRLEDMIEGEVFDIKLGSIKKYLNHKEIIASLKQTMLNKQLIAENIKKTVLGEKSELILNEEHFYNCLREIRTNILENRDVSDKEILLISLLMISNYIKDAFTKYEKEILNKKLEEISNSEIYKKAHIVIDIINSEAATDAMLISSL